RTESIRRSSSAPTTRCCAGGAGPRARAPSAAPSATGTTPSAARSSAASGSRAMTDTLTEAAAAGMLAEVRDGLSRPQKELPPKYFYDERGSELFEEITRLSEYYLTRTERALLERWMPAWIGNLRPRALVELGAGSAEKTRIVLDAIVSAVGAAAYVPVDVSADFLEATALRLTADYPSLQVVPVVAD